MVTIWNKENCSCLVVLNIAEQRECDLHVSTNKGNWEFNFLITVVCNENNL
jgi:hypothetical protein